MKKKEAIQKNYVQKTIRFPPDLFVELESTRRLNGHSLNAEVIARCRIDEVAKLRDEVVSLKSMIQEVLDHVRK